MTNPQEPDAQRAEPDRPAAVPAAYGQPAGTGSARRILVGVLAALFLAMLGVKILIAGGLEETALFYVGLPALIALCVAVAARPRNAAGTAVAATAIGLALAGPLLNEGIICLFIAAPLFFLVAGLIGAAIDASRRRDALLRRRLHAFVLVPLLAVVSLEGVAGHLPRENSVSVTRTIAATPDQFAAALAGPPRFDAPRPVFLQIPFPRPQSASGTGLRVGDERVVAFNPRRTLGIGSKATPRTMTLRIAESGEGRVLFRITQDSTTARWLDFKTSEVTWHAAPGGGTTVTWRLSYTRTFDPGWYFGPIQSYGMEQAADYLADTFTPRP